MFGREDAILTAFEVQLKSSVPRATILSYQFDGAIIQVPADELDMVGQVLSDVGERERVVLKMTTP
eukprot:5680155-Pyramimonas_sp.AAC.1